MFQLNPFYILLKRILGAVNELAQINGEDDGEALTYVWYLFVMLASIGVGVWAARLFMHSIPAGDHGMGGMVFVLLDIFIFFLGFAVSVTLMAKAAIAMQKNGRPVVGVAVIVFLFVGLYLPMHRESLAESREKDEAQHARQMAAAAPKQTENLPFVVPVSVPEMLEITRDGDAYSVKNRSGGELSVSLALVLFHDKLLDRCWARVELGECEPGSTTCPNQASSGVPGVPDANAPGLDTHPVLLAGEARLFATSHCDPRFAEGMLEYYVWNNAEQRFLFRSETTLIPDYH